MIVEREDNGPLYFIVGALLVAVAAFAIYFFTTNRSAPSPDLAEGIRAENSVAPAAGGGTSAEVENANGSSMTLSVDDNGTTATTTTQQ